MSRDDRTRLEDVLSSAEAVDEVVHHDLPALVAAARRLRDQLG